MRTGSNVISRPGLRSVSQKAAPKAKTITPTCFAWLYLSAFSTLASALRTKTPSLFFLQDNEKARTKNEITCAGDQ